MGVAAAAAVGDSAADVDLGFAAELDEDWAAVQSEDLAVGQDPDLAAVEAVGLLLLAWTRLLLLLRMLLHLMGLLVGEHLPHSLAARLGLLLHQQLEPLTSHVWRAGPHHLHQLPLQVTANHDKAFTPSLKQLIPGSEGPFLETCFSFISR